MRRATVVSRAEAPIGNSSRGRNGGLFSSSSSSSSDSDTSNGEDDGRASVGAVPPLLGTTSRSRFDNTLSSSFSSGDVRRRTMFSTSAKSLALSASVGESSRQFAERKGLFEADDDAGDSLETFHERVKLRQSKKQSELKALREKLDAAQQRTEDLEKRLSAVNKEKEECVIRTKECQRIIEKRNKQLMKVSERMARHSEQYELQVNELQAKVAILSTQCDQLRADVTATEEINRRERELKDQERLRELEMLTRKHKISFEATEAQFREQQVENARLAEKLCQVEQQLVDTAHKQLSVVQIVASEEYQSLMKRCENAEAISRGLNFQLAKEQHEKKYLRKQLTALQESVGAETAAATAASVGFLPDMLHLPNDGAVNPRDSVATITSETELASFDFVPDHETSVGGSVILAAPSLPEVSSPIRNNVSATRSQNRSRGLSASSCADDGLKFSMRDGKRRAASVQMFKTALDPPEKPLEDKPAVANGKSSASSVTFFGKLSSRFKRTSSPQNVPHPAKDEDDGVDDVPTGVDGVPSPLAQRQGLAQSKVLKERPRMYVARSPSHHEDESSDSIFGSESSSSDSSEEDMPPLPPPPPAFVLDMSLPIGASDVPRQLNAITDADVSSSNESNKGDDEEDEVREAVDKQIQFVDSSKTHEQIDIPGAPLKVKKALTSSSSLSPSSDDDSDHSNAEIKQPFIEDTKRTVIFSIISSSSDSSFSDDDESSDRIKNEARRNVRKNSLLGQDRSEKRSSRSPPSLKNREKSRIQSGSTSKSRMNEYMEDRARKRNAKLKLKQEKEHEETKKKEAYEKEWEKMAQEERERKRKQQQARRNGKRRPASMKTVRVSQMRHQMNSKQHKEHKDFQHFSPSAFTHKPRPHGNDAANVDGRRRSESKTSESEAEEEQITSTETPPLPPEPTLADTELYLRQQARLRERHELQLKKKQEADEADAIRGDIHRRVEMWAFGKELLHLILTLDQISSSDALKKCQLMVVQSPDDDTVRKAYRSIIRVVHPDKLRGATISEQLEAKELFTVLNQSFEKFKSQHS
ncbi:Auxilin-like protein and related proteins containing DnaJ domain [Plasmopara halstedii]|uniref:Auxilin-like protein and related proteins containing DnaJ domain n=1 Tax=Plasmopara halstedii TaxID=4781 RepID=A0A0P1A724_PLAHL|nr:Auxilin-like protein and related proteins containing DnaJ domain [Plasmopara halstedii]CEG36447.1 Auxilin-like protein and related proteins containing DnaJ domain [Plasmopara halstedii]|eukprot:XP_024572816.1 Auxilin-like protein and related proteins containing DnaJ domain [Plasmopara halstedii]